MERKRVIVVDDDELVRRVLCRWLEADGHFVREANSAERALAILAEEPADVAFCDIQMGGNDGLWLTREIRTRFPSTTVVLASGISSVPPVLSMQAGVAAYLVKPFERDAIRRAMALATQFTAQPSPEADADLDSRLDSLEKGL